MDNKFANLMNKGRGNKKDKECRACVDFENFKEKTNVECPLDKKELGRASWGLLHTMAEYYPKTPNNQEKRKMHSFMEGFAEFYPCKPCREHLQSGIENLAELKINVESREGLKMWLCRLHNHVNEHLGKEQFDCGRLKERWKTGWADKSCG